MTDEPILDVRGLSATFHTERGAVHAVRGVDFTMGAGEIVALVGESGSGKSTIGLALMRLVGQESRVDTQGEIWFRGKSGQRRDLMAIRERDMRHIRGDDIAMIFQEPMSSLNPIYTVGDQIAEAIRTHRDKSPREALEIGLTMLYILGIPDPEKCLTSYPHQLSGGMRQRVMIAMAVSCNPTLLVADEPTTALDVTIQAQIIQHLKSLQAQTGMSILFITHNLGLVAEIADRVLVLYAGQVVELADTGTLFETPLMPYTKALLNSIPRLGCSAQPDYRIEAIPGTVPSAFAFPEGCAFHTRCGHFENALCDAAEPPLEDAGTGRLVRCFRWRDVHGGAAT